WPLVTSKTKEGAVCEIGVKVDQRFRKALSPPFSSLLRLTQAYSSQGLRETRTLAGVGWNRLE
ncbi:MAG TPA: hypothetical protein VF077_07430, partial [Nitrospiraceae bacterium]